jgi:hypothetical protein
MTLTATSTTGTPTVPPTPAQVLWGAADHIDTYGWYQGGLYAPDVDEEHPPACAIGAILIAAHGRPGRVHYTAHHPADTAVWAALAVLAGYVQDHLDLEPTPSDDLVAHEGVIGDWNDVTRRTITDVTTALRAAAAHWDRLHPEAAASGDTADTASHCAPDESALRD